MKVKTLAVAATLVFSVVCGNNTEQPTSAEAFFGELAVKDLQEPNPNLNISIDSVVFTVESRDYRLDHITNNTGLCSSGGNIGNFGSNLITLTKVFIMPRANCDSIHIPQGNFRAHYKRDSLLLGPDTLEFNIQGLTQALEYTLRLTK